MDEQMRLKPHFPKSYGRKHVDHRRVLSGIIFVNRIGPRWRDAPREYAPAKTLYSRWNHSGDVSQAVFTLPAWSAFDAGVAAALADRPNDARMVFMSITDERVREAAGKLTKLLSEPEKLKGEITSLIVNHRIALRLREINSPPF
jgi:transposase